MTRIDRGLQLICNILMELAYMLLTRNHDPELF